MSVPANNPQSKINEWWDSVPADRKRIIMVVGALAIIMGASSVFNKRGGSSTEGQNNPRLDPKLDMNVVTAQRKEEGVPELRAQVDTLAQQLKLEQQKATEMRDEMKVLKDSARDRENAKITELERDLQNTREEVRSYKSDVLGTGERGKLTIPPLPEAVEGAAPKAQEVQKKPSIAIHGGAKAVAAAAPVAAKEAGKGATTGTVPTPAGGQQSPTSASLATVSGSVDAGRAGGNNAAVSEKQLQFLPAGTMFAGIMMNGIDAPTSSIAQKNPVPVLLRVKSLAFLPNRVTQDIRECFIILAGFGSLSSERAKLRTESISCIRNDGGVIETPIDGYAVGDDGKEGIGGTLVTKQGSLIARSLITGVLGGVASAMAPTWAPGLNTSGGGSWQGPDPSSVAAAGAIGGLRQTTTDVSRFYLETAKEMHPVIEIPSETEVTVVLVRGASLALSPLKPRSGSGMGSSSFFGRR